jgi:hypothetical protein
MKTIQAVGWFLFGIDTIALLFLLSWALNASARDGESAYAFVFLLFTVALIGVGGGGLAISSKRRSVLGLWCSTLLLAVPLLIVVALRISNSP